MVSKGWDDKMRLDKYPYYFHIVVTYYRSKKNTSFVHKSAQ